MSGTRLCAMGVLIALAASSPASGEAVAVDSQLEAVTVYRGQALVTRSVTLPARAGELELVVGDLPAQVQGPSLSASGADGVTIRSVRYRSRAVAAPPKKEVADLDARLRDLEAEKYANGQTDALLTAKAKHLDKLEGFTAPTAHVEMGKGVLNPNTLAQVSDWIVKQREALVQERVKLYKVQRDLNEQIELLRRKRAELTRGAQRTVREAVIFASKAAAAPARIELTYLVAAASWTPAYNVRLAADGKAVRVEYLAQVSQMSGEDWSDVKLTLSTATPAMNAQPPLLVPMWVGLVPREEAAKQGGLLGTFSQFEKGRKVLFTGQHKQLALYNTSLAQRDRSNWELNRLAAFQQRMELNVKDEFVRPGPGGRGMDEALAVSYQLGGRMSLDSRPDQQLVQISALKFAGQAYYEAVPILGGYVYRNLRLTNTNDVPLLPGTYSAYLDGEFVGKGTLPLVARGQECTLGLGVDPQLRCLRELAEKSDKIVWGSRVQSFRYRLRLENFKDQAVAVRLIERIPATKDEETLKISLGRMSDKLSTDPVYLRDEKDRGILRWDIRLAGKAAAAAARDVEYSFEMKFAKDAHVGREAAGLLPQMEMEFQRAAATR